jgi:MFS family permease
MANAEEASGTDTQRTVLRLSVLFAAMYFVQGISEPTEGLVGQPVKSFLADHGHNAAAVASFSALLTLPWMIKPFYGLLTDFVPLFGYRRRSYLLLATGATTAGLLALFALFTHDISRQALLLALLVPAVGIAITDVVIDAVMVEQGQRYGMTGRFQSVQWAAVYAAPILAAPIGGYLAHHGKQEYGFLICGLAAAVSFVTTLLFVREKRHQPQEQVAREAFVSLRAAVTTPGLAAVAGFLFLWNFNPFLNDVLYIHLTRGLGLKETDYGWSLSAMSAASVVASVAYGLYCRRVPFGLLLHASIALGVISTVGYLTVVGPKSAMAVMAFLGFTYMTAVLIQFDLMARACPPAVAATAFALLMSLTNVSLSAAITLGGHLYERWQEPFGPVGAFQRIVLIGAACSVACWLFVPALRRAVERAG